MIPKRNSLAREIPYSNIIHATEQIVGPIRTIPRVLLTLLLALNSIAFSSSCSFAASVFGIGAKSCGFWLYDDSGNTVDYDVKTWILGYFSGLNAANARHPTVGDRTDNDGILAEVRWRCQADPSQLVSDAALTAYVTLEAKNR